MWMGEPSHGLPTWAMQRWHGSKKSLDMHDWASNILRKVASLLSPNSWGDFETTGSHVPLIHLIDYDISEHHMIS